MVIPKKYTKGLSERDKRRQEKNIKTSKKKYKEGNYVDRPILKSYKHKKSNWTQKFKKKYGNCFGATALAGAITLQFIIGVIFYLPSSPVSLEQILRLLHLIIGLTVLSLAVALRVRFTHQSNSK